MAKKAPRYEDGWHSTGTLEVLPSVQQVSERLRANPQVKLRSLNTRLPEGWWSYDILWEPVPEASVRVRLQIHNHHPNAKVPAPRGAKEMGYSDYDPEKTPLPGYFHVYARADRAWDPAWPSPLTLFIERKQKPSYVTAEYGGPNLLALAERRPNLPSLFQTMASLPWLVTVLTHDDLDIEACFSRTRRLDIPILNRLPSGLYGRVIDFRIVGEPSRKFVNAALAKYDTVLPRGGAAILLSGERRKGIPKANLSFTLDKPIIEGGDLAPLSEVLTTMLRDQVMTNDEDAMKELHDKWFLLTEAEMLNETTKGLDEAGEHIRELEEEKEELLGLLASANNLLQVLRDHNERLLKVNSELNTTNQAAVIGWAEDRMELEKLQKVVMEGELGQVLQLAEKAREEAEADAEAAEELLDEQQATLASLRRENVALRQEVARLGSTFSDVDQPLDETEPESWEELYERAASLGHVVLGDVASEVDKLRGHLAERTFIRRSWEAMLALNGYAEQKAEHGADELPHFRAYLESPLAGYVIPRTRYSGSESTGVMMNTRFRAARILPVPRQVDESGRILMEAHIRIGSGKPPAPRLHWYDDTSGPTGKIYIGHLGPHLPNYQTN